MRDKRSIINSRHTVNRPLNPSASLLAKIGIILQETSDLLTWGNHDNITTKSSISEKLQDSEVEEWLHYMGELGLITRDTKD